MRTQRAGRLSCGTTRRKRAELFGHALAVERVRDEHAGILDATVEFGQREYRRVTVGTLRANVHRQCWAAKRHALRNASELQDFVSGTP